jgi:hypothetical protein
MNRNLLVISVTAAVVAAGATSATTMHNKHKLGEAGRYAAPSQPIPFAQLDSYLKGSRTEREKIESQTGAADTQTAQNGVTNPAMPTDQAAPTGATGDTGAMATPDQTRPMDSAGSADTSNSGLNGSAGAPQPGDATTGAPMNGPATPSASPNTPQ